MEADFLSVTPEAASAIKRFLEKEGSTAPIRIDIQSTGCCDASLGLSVDAVGESDLIQRSGGLTFLISPDIHQLVGKIHIAYLDEATQSGFVITSSNPLNEWEGFGVCHISKPR